MNDYYFGRKVNCLCVFMGNVAVNIIKELPEPAATNHSRLYTNDGHRYKKQKKVHTFFLKRRACIIFKKKRS